MGVVYRAEDLRLGRDVAVKQLSDDLLRDANAIERFRREARTASALNHPNICTVYEIDEFEGSPFLVMELLDGQTLKEHLEGRPLADDRLIDLAIEFAEALVAAHAANIIHRDLKPANLFVTRLGHLKILDFGLAKVVSLREDSLAPTAARDITASDTTLGTVAYMSPEQARGQTLDARTDLFSFGAVLYEMATGHRAFAASTTALTYDAIFHSDPPPMSERHAALYEIVRKALQKDREHRYQSAADIRADLKRLKSDSAPSTMRSTKRVHPEMRRRQIQMIIGITSLLLVGALLAFAFWRARPKTAATVTTASKQTTIAVLPFANLGSPGDRDYLKMAVPDELITILSRSPSLAVRPFAMTRRYATDVDPQTTGKALSVANIVTGSYREAGGNVEMTVETIDVERNNVVWRDSIAVPAADLIAMRNELSRRIRKDLLPRLNAVSGTDPSVPSNDEAYALFLQASAMSTDSPVNKAAFDMLERAVKLDPAYAPAWAALGWRAYNEYQYNNGGPATLARAREAHGKAVEIDPDLPYARRSGIVLQTETGDFQGAYLEAVKFVKRRPESADAHFALGYTLRYAGLIEEAGRECEIARSLDPLNRTLRSCSFVFLLAGDERRGIEFARLDSGTVWSNNVLMLAQVRRGNLAEAAKIAFETRLPLDQWSPLKAVVEKAPQEQIDGEVEKLKRLTLSINDGEQAYSGAEFMGGLGSKQAAIDLLNAAADRNYCAYPAIEKSPAFPSLRNTPEYARIRDRMRDCQAAFVAWRVKNSP